MKVGKAKLGAWQKVADSYKGAGHTVNIAMVGKYIELADAYKSIDEAVIHGAIANGVKVNILKIDSERFENGEKAEEILKGVDGILIPGGFGQRGILGMIQAAKYARENKIPYFGICLGLQIMVIEYSRNVLGISKADSSEFRQDGDFNVVTLLEEQVDVTAFGGTMRLGLSKSKLEKGTKIEKAYGGSEAWERHRHRYEVNNNYKRELSDAGLVISGYTPDGSLVEAVEWSDHPWGVSVQFHPEFTSKPVKAGPLFRDFVKAAIK